MAKKGRTTVYNSITSPNKMAQVNPDNLQLTEDFIEYLESIDRSDGTIKQYRAMLKIFWVWNLENNKNKFFVELTKREIVKFQNHAINEWGWSPSRIRTVKATISSLSNYIEAILDDEFSDYRPIVRKIESPANVAVREKTVMTSEELKPLLDKLIENGETMKACVLALAMYSGRRKDELTRFKVSYFQDENLICDGALYRTPEKMRTKGRGKKGKLLDVYIIAKPFKPYLDAWLVDREKLGVESDWLFPVCEYGNWTGDHIKVSTIDSYMRTFSRMTGENLYSHSLRHFFVSDLARQGIPDDVIKDIVGWSDISMVGVYKDIDAEEGFEKYFGADGIKKVEQKGLADL